MAVHTAWTLPKNSAWVWDGRASWWLCLFRLVWPPAFEVLQCLGNLSICKTNQEE